MAAATIPDEFDSPVGQLSGYTTLLKGRWVKLKTTATGGNFTGAGKTLGPAPLNDTTNLNPSLANKHVDIRSMITTDPDHGRPQRDMNLLHQMENAYHQTINSIGDAITGGTWKLTWIMPDYTHTYALTDDYVIARAPTTCTIARNGSGAITSGQTVLVTYTTATASYTDEAHTLTGTTPVALAHQAEGVVSVTVTVTSNTHTLTSADIPYNATSTQVRNALEAFIPQVIDSLAFDPSRPAVIVTGETFPYIVTFKDETVPPAVREIGSWVTLMGVDDSGLTSGGTANLEVANLRIDENWLKSASTDHLTQEEIETVAGSTQEDWGTNVGAGVTSIVVGKDSSFYNWRSMKVTFNGSAVNQDLISSTPLTPVNIEQLNSNHANTFIDLVIPEISSYLAGPKLDVTLCTIQFTSSSDGTFGGSTDSTAIAFSGNITGGTHFHKALSSFGSNTDWSRITGVKIHLESSGGNDPTNGDVLTFMALRALDTAWQQTFIDVNTRTGRLETPVALNAAPVSLAVISPYIRSINEHGATTDDAAPNTGTDPGLVDGAVEVKFNSGGQVSQAGEPGNNIILYVRQVVNTDGSWSWIQSQLFWGNMSGTKVAKIGVLKVSVDTSGTFTYTDFHLATVPTFSNNTDYVFRSDIEDTVLTNSVFTVDSEGVLGSYFAGTPIDSTNFTRVRGRVGWYFEFDTDMDVNVDYLRSSNVSFATLTSAIFHTRTPVDGAQLSVSASPPVNLWQSFELTNTPADLPTDDQLILDTNKKLSAVNSYEFVGGGANTYAGLQSNIVDFDDWTQMFLDFDVWMPSSLSAHNNVQQLSIETTGTPTGGTFTLIHDGAETAAIPYNATAAQVQTALGALGTIGVGNVLCTGGPIGSGSPPQVITIKFIDGLAGADVSTLIVGDNSITTSGGTSIPVAVQAGVRPQIFLKKPGTEGDYTTGTLGPFDIHFVPGSWTHVRLDLSILAAQATNPYRVQILTQQPTTSVWWVDNMVVGHRSVAWEMRAIEGGTWYPFLDVVNDPKGALHLPRSARGRSLQIQARALKSDAWVSSYTLKPHYAEIGRIKNPGYHHTHDDGIARVIGVVSGVDVYP